MADQAPVIAIDGPGGSGKGTVSQHLAEKLEWHFLDSGVLYRVLAYAAKQHSVAVDNDTALEILARHLDVQFKINRVGLLPRVIFEGGDVSDVVRGEEFGKAASIVAVIPIVRQALLERQRAFRQKPGLVADGRDMGTVVFPDAQLKVYLDASLEVRAKRRYQQLKEKGINVSLEQTLKELIERDRRDKERKVAPLKPAKDAIVIDTTHMSIEEVLQRILAEKEKKDLLHNPVSL